MNPLISIIIPNYNRDALIAETLDSIIMQTYQNWECIIVDDGSTDNSKEVIQKYVNNDNRLKLYDRPSDKPKGANSCRNYGFELSNGDLINWFDSDDIMLKEYLHAIAESYSQEKKFIIASLYIFDETLNKRKPVDLKIKTNLFKDYILWNFRITTGSVFFKRSFIDGKELFLTRIKRGQETELFSRLFFQIENDSYLIINKPLFLYRQHKDTKTHRNKTYNKTYLKSTIYITKENLKKCLILEDQELIFIFSHALLVYFKKALTNSDLKNSLFAITSLKRILFLKKPLFLFKTLLLELTIYPVKYQLNKILTADKN